MSALPIVALLTIIFVVGLIREPRSFWNAVVLLIDIVMILLEMSMGEGIFAKISAVVLLLLPVTFFGFAIFFIVNGVKILRRERCCLSNSLSLFLGIFMILGSFMSFVGMIYFQEVSIWRSLFFLVLLLECYLAFSFAAFFVYSWVYTYMPKLVNCDYIIIHGCGLKNGEFVTPMLKARVDKAVEVYKAADEKPKVILSGGKGRDEKISEAQAMENYLLGEGFSKDSLILEDKSSTTFENLRNVRNMLDVDGRKNRYIFVTNNYHVFRTGLYARKLKMNAQGVGCKTAAYYWSSAFIREYIAILVKYKWAFCAIALIWGAIEAMIYLR